MWEETLDEDVPDEALRKGIAIRRLGWASDGTDPSILDEIDESRAIFTTPVDYQKPLA